MGNSGAVRPPTLKSLPTLKVAQAGELRAGSIQLLELKHTGCDILAHFDRVSEYILIK